MNSNNNILKINQTISLRANKYLPIPEIELDKEYPSQMKRIRTELANSNELKEIDGISIEPSRKENIYLAIIIICRFLAKAFSIIPFIYLIIIAYKYPHLNISIMDWFVSLLLIVISNNIVNKTFKKDVIDKNIYLKDRILLTAQVNNKLEKILRQYEDIPTLKE